MSINPTAPVWGSLPPPHPHHQDVTHSIVFITAHIYLGNYILKLSIYLGTTQLEAAPREFNSHDYIYTLTPLQV